MPILILIPMIYCVYALFRDSTQKAFLNGYLPVFMLFPVYYYWKVASLPPIDLSEAALLPLGAAMVIKELPRWRVSLMDLWLALFTVSAYYADMLHRHDVTWTFDLFSTICLAVIPYMAGKLLIEQNDGRTAMVKRMVFLLFVASIISMYEYKMEQNPFSLAFGRFFPDETFAWKTQIRWGFGRVSGPFGQSELAGMMLFFGLVLTLYLTHNGQWEEKFARAPWLPFRKSTCIAWTIGITLLMTQARGPWIGSLLAVPIAMIGRARRTLLAAVVFGSLCIVGGTLSYIGLQHYANAPATSAEQETANYRQHLVENYVPVAQAGGPWGWGQDFPRAPGQGSIDNEYLFIALTQGWVGLLAFSALAIGGLFHLVTAAVYNPTKKDRYFAYSLLGVFIGLLVTIFTVFLGNQPFELFFLLLGWSQAVRVRKDTQPSLAFQHVYS